MLCRIKSKITMNGKDKPLARTELRHRLFLFLENVRDFEKMLWIVSSKILYTHFIHSHFIHSGHIFINLS